MAANTFDSVLSWLIPTILILGFVGFVWVKIFSPYVMPMLKKFWNWLNGKSEEQKTVKEVTYE